MTCTVCSLTLGPDRRRNEDGNVFCGSACRKRYEFLQSEIDRLAQPVPMPNPRRST